MQGPGIGWVYFKTQRKTSALRSKTTLRQALPAIQTGESELMLPLSLLLRSSLSLALLKRRARGCAELRRSVGGKIQIHHLFKFKLSCNWLHAGGRESRLSSFGKLESPAKCVAVPTLSNRFTVGILQLMP